MASSQTRTVTASLWVLSLVLLTFDPTHAQVWPWGGIQNTGCSWGTQPIAIPGQCAAFQCVSPWFGSSFTVQCPFGQLFSGREGSCVNPVQIASQCTANMQGAPAVGGGYGYSYRNSLFGFYKK